MSRNNNSDGVKGCMDQMNNSGNTADPSSRGESKNRPSQMDSAGATSQHRSNENGKGAGQERTPASGENAEKMTKNTKSDEVQNSKPNNSTSGEGSSNQPSQSAPMDTSDASSVVSSLGTSPKSKEQWTTYPIQKLKTMQDLSREFNPLLPKKEHTILIDVRITQLHP